MRHTTHAMNVQWTTIYTMNTMIIMHYNDYNALQYKTPHIQWMCNSYNGLQWCQCITMNKMVYNENLTHEMNVQWSTIYTV